MVEENTLIPYQKKKREIEENDSSLIELKSYRGKK